MNGVNAHIISGDRLHLNHGPIDLIIKVWGPDNICAYSRAKAAIETVLADLMGEIGMLRAPVGRVKPKGKIAWDMWWAASDHTGFVTPMAAVAGAIADHICGVMCAGLNLEKAYVNNGGDIAIYLGDGQTLTCATPNAGRIHLHNDQNIRGLATSGWQGRSHSLGIADSVTVLAESSAKADVAATLIANAINLENHPAIKREPANTLAPDSDLGERLVTVSVGALTAAEINTALKAGQFCALDMLHRNLISGAALSLCGDTRIVGHNLPEIHHDQTGEPHARLQTA